MSLARCPRVPLLALALLGGCSSGGAGADLGDPGGRADMALPPTGNPLWGRRVGGAAFDAGGDVAVTGKGGAVLCGTVEGRVDLGGGPADGAGGYDAFVATFDLSGEPRWSRRFGGLGPDRALSAAVDREGNVLLTGSFSGAVDFGGGALQSAGGTDVFLVKLGPDGAHLWSRRLGASGDDAAYRVAVDAQGNAVLAGSFRGMVDFGGGPLVSAGGADGFVARFSADGAPLWSRAFGDAQDDGAFALAVDGEGAVLVGGGFKGAMDLGTGPLRSAGADDGFFARLGPGGAPLWARRYGGAGNDEVLGLAAAPGGDVLVTGHISDAADLGGGPLQSAGGFDVCLGRYSPAGAHLWSRRFGGPGEDVGRALAVDGAGNVLLGGHLSDGADFGGGPLRSAGLIDVAVVKLDGAGAHLWSKRFGGPRDETVAGLAVDGSGVVVGGSMEGPVELGGAPLQSAGGYDVLLLRLAP